MLWEIAGSITGGVLRSVQVTYFFSPHSVASNRNKYQGRSLYVKCGWDVQLTALQSSCAECQSKDGSPTFHPPSEYLCLFTGNLYILPLISMLAASCPIVELVWKDVEERDGCLILDAIKHIFLKILLNNTNKYQP